MAEEEGENAHSIVSEPDRALGEMGANPKAPGWYPSRSRPSNQTYWDGQNWTARRRWTAGKGWLVVGDAPEEALGETSAPSSAPRMSPNPYVGMSPARSKATGFTFNLGILILLVCGIALMYGSVGEWVHVTGGVGIANFHVSINGIDPGVSTLITVNGWVTFIGGVLLVIFACFEMTSEEIQLAVFTTIIAAVTLVFAIYDMFRIVQKISLVPAAAGTDVSVGWGLICVLSATVLATLIAIVRLLQR
ncbi:MAG TPA: hypothetical protein VNG12_27670 [Acidimicrobiales bacterium]|nr:hypothetical protein [Acidimicrobiales bacterium]